jgi:hypothetical protein
VSQAVSQFITDLAVHFGRKHDTPEAEKQWLQSMFSTLRPYGADTLKYARERIINTRTERSFPLPAECKKVCDLIASREEIEHGVGRLAVDKVPPQFSDARIKLADDLVMTPMGKEAAKDGWILALHDFCRDNARLPGGNEIAKVKAVPKGFDAAYRDCMSRTGALDKALLRLGDKMITRRKELTDMVLHGVVR